MQTRRYRPLALYLAGSFLARSADEGVAVTAALLAVTRTGSVALGAEILACWMAPHVLVAPVVGSLVTRVRRPTSCYAVGLAVFAAAIVGLGTFAGRGPVWLVLGVAVVGGSCGPLVSGGLSSLVAALVPAERQARAYALDAAGYTAAAMVGPALATVVARFGSPGLAAGALGGAAALAVLPVVLLPVRRTSGPAARPGVRELADGLALLWRRPVLRGVTAGTCVAYFGIGALTVTAVLLAGRWGDATEGGVLVTAFAVGGLCGSLLMARRPPRVAPERLAGWCLLGSALTLGLAAVSPNLPVGAVLFGAAGMCDGPLLGATLDARARHAPERARAQVFTMGAAVKISAAAAGSALVGTVADLPPALLLAAIAAVQLAAYAALRLLPRLRVASTAPDVATDTDAAADTVPNDHGMSVSRELT